MERGGYRGRGGGGNGGRGGGGRGGGSGGRGGGRGGHGGRGHHNQQRWVSGQGGSQGADVGPGQGGGEGSLRGGYGERDGGGRGWNRRDSSRGRGPSAYVPVNSPRFQSGPGSSSWSGSDSVVREMESVQISEQLPPSSAPQNTEPSSSAPQNTGRTLPVKRPDKGGMLSIRDVRLRVNHFPLKFSPESIIMHYDVDIKPEIPPKHGRPSKLSKSLLAMIRNKLFSDDPTRFPLSMTAYDGEKNIFSAVPLPTGIFKVEFSEGEDMKIRSYIFTIKLVNELKLRKLKDYLSGNLLSIPRDILQGMDVVVKENPARQMISFGRSFFRSEFHPEDDLGWGITASRGFQHSLKPTSQGLTLCLDYSVLAFRKRMPVIDFLHQHIPGFNLNEFRNFRREVENALKGLKVTVTHRITKQKYTIAGLTYENTQDVSFTSEDPDGNVPPRTVYLVDYFWEKYNRDIMHRNIPCLDLGKNNRKNYVPMEFCVLVEGQRYPKEDLDRDAAIFLKGLSLPPPKVRQNNICDMVRRADGPCGGGIIQNFGMEVDMNMTTVAGRVIGPPELKLGNPNGRVIKITVDRDKCHWNLVGKSVVVGIPIKRWAVLDFSASDRRFRLYPDQFIPKLINRCRNLGIDMEEPLIYQATTMNKFSKVDLLRELLESISERAYKISRDHLQIVVCVMAKRDPGYKYLKWISETRVGIVTQCCLSNLANKANDQYLANLALKINGKLGGSNVELNDRLPHFEGEGHVMFIGADVNHPGAQVKTSPSIAAVVATVNWPAANRYAARVCPQEHRTERILKFADMCVDLVESYARLNRVKPDKIVVFRDGVSESQFDMVLNEELIDMKRAFQTRNYFPTITLIVAQKRHQTRLFPEGERDGCSTGNVPPGTVVDTKIVHPFEFDFYLCSHYGSLGTSKPTHYHVLWDEHGFSSDQLQKIIYNMCYTFARCTKPVSLVPPVYYADLVAYRGRLYYEAVMEGQSPRSAASSSSSSLSSLSSLSSAASLDERSYKLHDILENNMFFL